MKENRLAISIFILSVIIVGVAGYTSGFWIEVAPFVWRKGGPAGLDGTFAASLVSGGLGIIVQVAFTFLIVSVLAGREGRRLIAETKESLARDLCDLYAETAKQFAGYKIKPTRGAARWETKDVRFNTLRSYTRRALTPFEQKKVDAVNALWDEIVFDKADQKIPEFKNSISELWQLLTPDSIRSKLVRVFVRQPALWRQLVERVESSLDDLLAKRAMFLEEAVSSADVLASTSSAHFEIEGFGELNAPCVR